MSLNIIAFTHTTIYAMESTSLPSPTFIHSSIYSSSTNFFQNSNPHFKFFQNLKPHFKILPKSKSPFQILPKSKTPFQNSSKFQFDPITISKYNKKMFINGVLCSLFVLLVAGVQFSDANESTVAVNSTAEERMMVPWIEPGKGEMMGLVLNESRRKLSRFQICSLCTCCARGGGGGGKGYCLPSPCCYAINCNIPNRPFGFCSFTPKTCNCFRCHL